MVSRANFLWGVDYFTGGNPTEVLWYFSLIFGGLYGVNCV